MMGTYYRRELVYGRGGSAFAFHEGIADPDHGLVAACNRWMILDRDSGACPNERIPVCRRCARVAEKRNA